jgi:3-oxoacyl-[acyl-carrier-protein] synthase II
LSRRVVVTGMGALSPIGNSSPELLQGLQSGENGIGSITHFDTSEYSVKIAGQVEIDLESHIEKKELNRIDRFSAFAIIASDEAIKQSGINNAPNLERVGVIIGSGVGGIQTFEDQHTRLMKSPRRVSPFFIPAMISDIAPGHVSIKYGFKGPNYSLVSACATATHAIGDAFRMIKYGDADAIISGGTEAPISPISIAGFSNMKALTKNSDIHTASRPFDAERDGFVMGEGAGILVLEELQHALDRGAHIIGEISGYGATGDAYHLTSPAPNGEGAARAMNRAIEDANLSPNDVNYINAHGTSTPYNDKNETTAIHTVFGEHASQLHISSTKSMTGHLLGAAGGIEAIASLLSIENNFIPPTIHLENSDPECDLNYTPNVAKQNVQVDVVISNTFGFGGHNAVILFNRYNP